MPYLSLLISFRNRHVHLQELLRYFSAFHPDFEIEFILLEGDNKPTLHDCAWPDERFRYEFIEQQGVFHKTALLNKGLSLSKGDLIIAYDVDLLPVDNALGRSVEIASSSDKLLIAGYRLMAEKWGVDPAPHHLSLGPEDSASALKKYLLGKELFGVCPVYRKERLLEIGGWDEKFKGWGAEDQDILERYCHNGIVFLRSPQITYIHLSHEKSEDWNNSELMIRNRELYATKKLRKI